MHHSGLPLLLTIAVIRTALGVSCYLTHERRCTNSTTIKHILRDFLGSPVAKTPRSQCMGPQFDLWSGN